MLVQLTMKSGQSVIANVEKFDVIENRMGEIVDVKWTNKEDAYSELRYIKVSEIVAVVMIHNEQESSEAHIVKKVATCAKCRENISYDYNCEHAKEICYGKENGYPCSCHRGI